MATLPFVGPALKHRRPLTGSRLIIVASAAAFAIFLLWASLAHVDEVTRGEGKVIPSSKLQVITAADAATVSELRQSLGSNRRVVVPLLEYLDRTFVTVRRGDKRALR